PYFTPTTAIDEGDRTASIANTADDPIFATYRGNVGTSTPISGRVLSYALPLASGRYDVRLYFAERAHTSTGKRLFDIEAEGSVLRDDFDLFAAAGGTNTATILPLKGVAVTDGTLNLVFRTEVDFAAINGIEILPATAAPQPTEATYTTVSWTTAAPSPHPNSEAQGTTVDGKIYFFGGFSPCCVPTGRSYVFDPVANSWTALTAMPTPATHAGVAADGRNIYIAGGYIANSTNTGQIFGTKQVWRYNIDSNAWTRMPDLPVERSAGSMVVLGRELHYIGGTNLSRTMDVGDHYVFNIDSGTAWTTRAPLPNPRHHAGAVVLNGKIYFVGGQHGHDAASVTENDVHAYDPAANAWTQMADLPKARSHMANSTVVHGGRIVVMGGEVAHSTHMADVTAYSPSKNAWTALTPLPQTRNSGVGGVVSGVLYMLTGSNTTTTYKGTPGN
ncbi:MAG: hypothetical protein ICV72_10515, partial [Aldersonia sp.]|nr:hypothetical protein [Aldersonia sp.]